MTTGKELRLLAARSRRTGSRASGRPRHQRPTASPADRLPPPERPLRRRLRDLLAFG
ncbi:hypothetical protein AB0D10_30675 [Kitasatospora sp. NPDC048545]|uniref:hypothetical protein n=1 Tax=Kitasatospora sp. NPDC048545 TaxID=3157208 RepID=UPI0033FA42AE